MGEKKTNNFVTLKTTIDLPLAYAAGETASKFFFELRDSKRIFGTRCRRCNKVYCPPRKVCPQCYSQMNEWVELSGKGVLKSFTVVHSSFSHLPFAPPLIYGVIKLEGADNNFVHLIAGAKPEEITTGMLLEPVFRDERKGSILDITYFQPLREVK